MDTPRRPETGRPRAAQFAPRAVYIQDGNATGCGKKVTLVEPAGSGLLGRARARGGLAFGALAAPHRRAAPGPPARIPTSPPDPPSPLPPPPQPPLPAP